MTFTTLINAVHAALAPLAAAAGGEVLIAESLEAAHKFLSAAPNRWRLVLHWEGYAEHPAAREGMATHQVATVIQQPEGLAHRPGDTLSRVSPAGSVPFSDLIALVAGWMAALRFPDGTGADSAGFSLAGSEWVDTPASRTRTHALNWRLDAAMAPYSQTIPLTF